jgi:alpha-tubulin suppressor-like RCC1 family protein
VRTLLLSIALLGCGSRTGLPDLESRGSAASAAPLTIVSITVGERHACALRANGEALCWGDNDNGQLGDDTFEERHRPTRVVGLAGVEITAGRNHTCARVSDGSLRCWGHRALGQLGDGAPLHMTTIFKMPAPVPVASVSEARTVASGDAHTCTITSGGTLCFGSNDFGQLGDGRTERQSAPTAVLGLVGPVQLALGAAHGCARLEDRTLRCWGSNESGQLIGLPADRCGSYDCARRAIETGVGDVAQVAAAGNRTCILATDGSVSCVGALTAGTSYAREPVAIDAVAEIALGSAHSCARREDGTVWCWGEADRGQLANIVAKACPRGSGSCSLEPLPVALPAAAKSIALGGDSSCALLTNGDVYCWGRNDHGQIGDGTTADATTPVRVAL